MNKQDYINSIREEYSGMKNKPRKGFASSIKTLAEDLYAKESHFIFELIQNAEDNNYPDSTDARLRFEVCQLDIEGQKVVSLIVHNNEIGFNKENVGAICDVGQSTKKKTQGYIGEKGIGFKSVFRITNRPYIFSNGFQFCLPEQDDETGLGYIVPLWIFHPPREISAKETSIILPLNKNNNDVDDVIKALREIAPETILFLTKLRSLEVSIQLPKIGLSYNLTIEKKVLKTIDNSQLVELTCKNEDPIKGVVIDTFNYWVTEIEFEKPKYVQHEKRIGIESRVVSVAIPLDGKTTKGKLFAYLPVWEETRIPFLINADFLLVSSREGILENEDWNKWLRNCVVETYTSSFLSLLNTPKISFETKITGYTSIPVETHYPFLESVIKDIRQRLSYSDCVFNLPDKTLITPSKSRFCNHKFRELLAEIETLPAYLVHTIQIICSEMEKYLGGLKAIGVKNFTFQDVLCCLADTDWLEEHELIWFVKLYRYIKIQTFDPTELQKNKIIPVKGKKTYNLSCVAEQPVYFSLDADDKAALKGVPEWLTKLVPIAELDTDFEELLYNQNDHDGLIKWMEESLRIYKFSKENYCVDVITKIEAKITQLDLEQIMGATQWLEQNASEKFNWDNLPVVLTDKRKMLLAAAKKLNLVVPETCDQVSGWQHIWAKAEDRTHFVVLNNAYSIMTKKWFIEIGAKFYPQFKIVKYAWYSTLKSDSETGLLATCRKEAATSRYDDTKVLSYELPSSLIDFPKKTYSIKLVSESLLSYLRSIDISHSTDYYFNSIVHQAGLFALGTYENRGTYSRYSPSFVLEQLRNLMWFPTTKGYAKPSQTFLPKKSIKEILGDTVPYFEGTLPESICLLLEVRTEVTVTELIALLRDNSGSDKPSQELIERVYEELFIRTERNSYNIKEIFSNESLIYLSSGKQANKWFKSDECVWEEAADILGKDFAYLQKRYPKMFGFFVSRLGVKERLDTECFAKRWLQLQETPLNDLKKQRELLECLYREIKPVALMSEDGRPEWWDNYFFDQAKLYSQLDNFCEAADIILPDDKFYQNMFNDTDEVQFAWYPEYGSFSDWISFFRTFEVPLLSESVTENLVENVVSEITQINHYVTESAVKMIASWLREKRQTEFDKLLGDGVFKHLLLLRESSVSTDLEIEFCLETECGVYDTQIGLYPAFWDRNAHILYYNIDVNKSQLAQILAKSLIKNYKDLADWIELVLESDSTERLKSKIWNVPREIIDLFREKQTSVQFAEEPLEEAPVTISVSSLGYNEKDAEFLDSEVSTSSVKKAKSDTGEDFGYTHNSLPPTTLVTLPTAPSIINKPHTSGPSFVHQENTNGVDEKGSATSDANAFNYLASLKNAFTQNGLTQFNDDIMHRINNGDDGVLPNSSRRAERLAEAYLENINNEPTAEARRKETERSLLESPNEAVRASLFEWYQGKCQICGDTWPKKDGNPYFAAAYIVERQNKRWLDEPGNSLCLCAKHFAQWRLATKQSTTEITDQIAKLRLHSEGGGGDLSIRFQLVGHDTVINLNERHALALRTLVGLAENEHNNIESQHDSKHPPINVPDDIYVDQKGHTVTIFRHPNKPQNHRASNSNKNLTECPYCQVRVNELNFELHVSSKCPKRPALLNDATAFSTLTTSNILKNVPIKINRCRNCGSPAMAGSDTCYSCG